MLIRVLHHVCLIVMFMMNFLMCGACLVCHKCLATHTNASVVTKKIHYTFTHVKCVYMHT